ncbi:hypothetical protein ACU635_21805 [[Actinomadura] parvosata]|uniref:hypothetical protein n=1 Tax=[Actinomadura] parvosata TaxID=1955412 RepID=UPI00406D0534
MRIELPLDMTGAAVEQAFRQGAAIFVAVVDEGANPTSSQVVAGAADSGPVLARGREHSPAAPLGAARTGRRGRGAPGPGGGGFRGAAGGAPRWHGYGAAEPVAGAAGADGGMIRRGRACAEAAASVRDAR